MDMDSPDLPPLPPLPLGDQAGPPADTDALRGILRRHRRRQVGTGALALAVVLAAGGAAGFAVGHSAGGPSHGTQLAANAPATGGGTSVGTGSAPSSASGGPVSSGGEIPTPAVVAPGGTYGGPAYTQLLVRDASDGTRVRLYEQEFPVPTVACPSGTACPMVPACAPTSLVTAEVSDDQVAGQLGGPVWPSTAGTALRVDTRGVVGGGQPQPILVVVAQVEPSVASVTLTTPDGTDQSAPTGGWVALAVRLPADFGTNVLSTSTLTASDSSGKAVVSGPLAQSSPVPMTCMPVCAALGQSAQGNAGGAAPNTKLAPAIAGVRCGCLPVAPATDRSVASNAVCIAVPPGTGTTTNAPPPGAQGGGAGASPGSVSSGPAVTTSSSVASPPPTVPNP